MTAGIFEHLVTDTGNHRQNHKDLHSDPEQTHGVILQHGENQRDHRRHNDIYDKYKPGFNTKKDIKYDFAFICVDTPYCKNEDPKKDILNDISKVEEALQENDANIYIIKSTILPGCTKKLSLLYLDKKIVFSPEFYGGTQHCNNFEFNFTIIGCPTDKKVGYEVQQLLQEVYDARHIFRVVDSTTAELDKYMENSWLGLKVKFCNEFGKMSDTLGVDYEELRELFILDPRINPSHTYRYNLHPFYQSHCLDKDIPAIAKFMNNEFLLYLIESNNKDKIDFERKKNEK